MKRKILKKETSSGTSGTHDLFIKVICSHSKSRETIPLIGHCHDKSVTFEIL